MDQSIRVELAAELAAEDGVRSEALGVARLAAEAGSGKLILAAHSEAQAARLAAAARTLAPELSPVLLPAWDCLPFDRVSPSRAVMGQRMAALHALASGRTRLLIASVEALAQRLPPAASAMCGLTISPGQVVSHTDLQTAVERLGYALVDEVDQPGEAAFRDTVIDIFPADSTEPVRLRLEGGSVAGLDAFDAMTQRSRSAVQRLTIGPASELIFEEGEAPPRVAGLEHALPDLAGPLASVFELMPGVQLVLDEDAGARMEEYLAQVEEARATRIALCRAAGGDLPAAGLHLDQAAWQAACATHHAKTLVWPMAEALPSWRNARDREATAEAFVTACLAVGRRVAVCGARLAHALDLPAGDPVAGWAALLALPAGSCASLPAGLAHGFAADGAVVIGPEDVLPPPTGSADPVGLFDVALRPGDAVIHLDYGMARLDGIETVQAGQPADCLVLGFAGEARKLVPCDEMDRVWRYGNAEGVRLDRADGSSWRKRQGRVVASLDATAARLIEQMRAREAVTAPAIRPPRRAMDRFAAGFAFTPTPDQARVFTDIAADLTGPRPMDRLLCGDVGYGKTEAALRAAAAAALAGHQVAILAPTTVLVRQHFSSFRRRLAAVGVEVASLSRLTRPAEARAIRARLAEGSLRVVIGTHALAGRDVAFANLALVIVDEEQRFGTKAKAALASLRDPAGERGVHALTLSATPIPRTLQGALTGLQLLSVLSTPPARRQPVRTFVLDLDDAVICAALMREHARGGQSFCVCPRIADLQTLADRLERLVPDLSVVVLHGKLKPDAMDAALVGFSEGHGDVLLSTDIVEAGLDIPRANTILVFDADRFGLAQLHQLRGRVGRGRARGMAWLFTDPAAPPGSEAEARLAALAAHDGLGAGFAVAARDLDLRGAGDLLGEGQSGHAKLLGVELARHLLARALARARGEAEDDWRPEMTLDLPAAIPADYMPDPATRIALHARLARPGDLAALGEELADRFGPLPDMVRYLLAQAGLRDACRRLGVARLEAGPSAVAAELRADPPPIEGVDRKDRRLILRQPTVDADERLTAAHRLLRAIGRAPHGPAA